MAYASWSVTFGEQPSAAKWNILGTNDASFNDGTGIGTNAIAAASLKTNAIKLGYTELTADANTSGTSETEVTGLATTVTIPSGSRSIIIMGSFVCQANAAANMSVNLWDGAVTSGTLLVASMQGINGLNQMSVNKVVTPAAGSKTYRVSVKTSSGTATMRGTGTPTSGGNLGPSTLTVLAI